MLVPYEAPATATAAPHVHDPYRCPPHVAGCNCPDIEGSLCNPYYVAGHCPDGIEVTVAEFMAALPEVWHSYTCAPCGAALARGGGRAPVSCPSCGQPMAQLAEHGNAPYSGVGSAHRPATTFSEGPGVAGRSGDVALTVGAGDLVALLAEAGISVATHGCKPTGSLADVRARLRELIGPSPTIETGHRMTGGGIHVWHESPLMEEVCPMERRVALALGQGDEVCTREIIVISDWAEVTPKNDRKEEDRDE